jgi:nucleoredoxin
VGIYFSMHNCPPCRQFTPVFAELYNELSATGDNKLEVVFCSGDRDEATYNEYYGEMPWLALPFKDARLAGLAKKFDVRGVPRLIVINKATGAIIEQNGVQKVMMEGPSAIEEYLSKAK